MMNISCDAGHNRVYVTGRGEALDVSKKSVDISIDTPAKINPISSIVEKVKCSVREVRTSQGNTLHLVSNSFDSEPDESMKSIQVAKDFHGTLSLFQKSLQYATTLSKQGKTGIVVKAYAQDIGNPAFLEFLTEARKEGVVPESVVIELSRDDYGLLNYTALSNINEFSGMGFGFAIHDFVEENGTIFTRYAHKLQGKVIPKFIHISENVIRGIRDGILKFTDTARRVINDFKSRGISFLVSAGPDSTSPQTTLSKDCSELLGSANISTEDFVNIRGKVMGAEGLVRFKDGISVPDGLGMLKREDGTLKLLEKCISNSVPDVMSGRNRSVNAYLKDLGNPLFVEMVTKATFKIPKESRGYLVFEILEERYGALNNMAIANLSWLKSRGFSIAIDDLDISEESRGMSLEILDTLIDEQIGIDIVKIDGTHAEAIRTGNMKPNDIHKLRQLVSQGIPGSQGQKHPIFIVEWIKSKVHAIQVTEALGKSDAMEFWYQGRDLVPAEFRAG